MFDFETVLRYTPYMIKEKTCENNSCANKFYGTKRAKFCSDLCRLTKWRNTMYAVVRIGSKIDKTLLSGEKKSTSPLFSKLDIAEAERKKSKKPELYRIAEIQET